MWNLGIVFAMQGELSEAKENYCKALAGFQALLGPSSKECQFLERELAFLHFTQGKNTKFITPFVEILTNTHWKTRATAEAYGRE